jgi:hypothetical protein
MNTRSCAVFFLIAVTIPSAAFADDKPVQLALFNPIQIFPEETSITGIRLSLLYGKNVSVTGLDIGLVNMTSGGTSTGIQWGGVGINRGNFVGWQANWVSLVDGNTEGLQWGLFNKSGHMGGLQFGLINMTETMNGIQLGLLNFISKGGFMPFFPIVNWSLK